MQTECDTKVHVCCFWNGIITTLFGLRQNSHEIIIPYLVHFLCTEFHSILLEKLRKSEFNLVSTDNPLCHICYNSKEMFFNHSFWGDTKLSLNFHSPTWHYSKILLGKSVCIWANSCIWLKKSLNRKMIRSILIVLSLSSQIKLAGMLKLLA